MILRKVAALQAEDALGSPGIDVNLAEHQPLPMPLERDILILNQPVEVGATQMEVARHLVYLERPVWHTPRAAMPLATGPAGAVLSSELACFLLRPPPGLLIDLIEGAAVVPNQLELGQNVTDVPLLFHLLVQEPLQE